MVRCLCMAVLFLLAPALADAEENVGFHETVLDEGGPRPIHVSLWYPTSDQAAPVVVGENRVFYGVPAIRDAVPAPGGRALVVLSHGYGGSWRNLSWLADSLVRQGYIVASPDHSGTTTFDRDPAQATRLWERPRDLKRVIDALAADASLAGTVDAKRIAAIGHSLGGWTVTALAGARFDTKRLEVDCRANGSLRACALKSELGLTRPELEADLGDPRLGAFVSLDLGLARGVFGREDASFTGGEQQHEQHERTTHRTMSPEGAKQLFRDR